MPKYYINKSTRRDYKRYNFFRFLLLILAVPTFVTMMAVAHGPATSAMAEIGTIMAMVCIVLYLIGSVFKPSQEEIQEMHHNDSLGGDDPE